MFQNLIIFCVIFLSCDISVTYSAIYPKDLPKCHFGDQECFRDAVQFILRKYPNGDKKLHLQSFEPLDVDFVQLIQDRGSPVAINLTISDLKIYGISKSIILKTEGFGKTIGESDIKVTARAPEILMAGNYEMNGNILILPVTGKGRSNFTLKNFEISFRFKPNTIVRRGREYIETSRFKVEFDTERAYFNFENAFNGNKELGDNMNVFLNENWRDILNELRPAGIPLLEQIFGRIFNRFLSKFPYSELFLENEN